MSRSVLSQEAGEGNRRRREGDEVRGGGARDKGVMLSVCDGGIGVCLGVMVWSVSVGLVS